MKTTKELKQIKRLKVLKELYYYDAKKVFLLNEQIKKLENE